MDRPAVYRALAQLERDRLVEASSQSPRAGQARRVYRITALGERVLRIWMGVIKEEHDCLGEVLRRYQATGTTDAVLAEVDGGWADGPGFGLVVGVLLAWPAAPGGVAANWMGAEPAAVEETIESPGPVAGGADQPEVRVFRLIPDRSVVLIEVRSTVGPLSFGAIGVTGWVEAAVAGGVVQTDRPPSGRITIDVSGLRSGNGVYDAELLRRIDARRFPTATVDLKSCAASGLGDRYHLEGEITFHGVARPVQGAVDVTMAGGDHLVITGEQALDIRDFAIPSPTVLMLRIYPDVRVRLHAEAELEDSR